DRPVVPDRDLVVLVAARAVRLDRPPCVRLAARVLPPSRTEPTDHERRLRAPGARERRRPVARAAVRGPLRYAHDIHGPSFGLINARRRPTTRPQGGAPCTAATSRAALATTSWATHSSTASWPSSPPWPCCGATWASPPPEWST